MKSYELYTFHKGATEKHESFTNKFMATPDPKREGMYKVSVSTSLDNYKKKNRVMFGKCNQAEILKMIKTMKEV
tara:strand:- start:252 stop:473 length:222 start_codon:yes stop_codon:yes gene_type:complete